MTPIDYAFLAAMGLLTFVPVLYALWYFCNGRSLVPGERRPARSSAEPTRRPAPPL
jgi:hypothetical protein